MSSLAFTQLGASLPLTMLVAPGPTNAESSSPAPTRIQDQLLKIAAEKEAARRTRFAAITTPNELHSLQSALRAEFLELIGGLPEMTEPPPVTRTGHIEAEDYVIDKLVYESLPGYFVSALLYRPKNVKEPCPAVLSPCGHSSVGKAADSYQILHINLARRGFVVLTYDPVGQGERSQFWDAENGKSRFNLVCGEHAVLGNPLYLFGTSLARYRIWDGIRGLDLLASLPEVDPKRIGCAGNSGGGTLTAYIAALDPRVAVAAICCYITTLPRRMENRIFADPDSDPEQDIFDFVGRGIDHAGLLALRTPRPTLLGCAQRDFFPIEGARETFAEAQHLYTIAHAKDRIAKVEANEKHGLTLPLRLGVYQWFSRWLLDEPAAVPELPVTPRPHRELLVCEDGQVNVTYRSRPLLSLAREQFRDPKPPADRTEKTLRELLRLDPDWSQFRIEEVTKNADAKTAFLLINGNESRDWREEKGFLKAIEAVGNSVSVVDSRGVGTLRHTESIAGRNYTDPLAGVEENIAYNAFLVGKSLIGMRVTDVLQAISQVARTAQGARIVLCGRGDAAFIACLATVLEPQVHAVVTESLRLNHELLFDAKGTAVNAATILPGLLQKFGDTAEILELIGSRPIVICKGLGSLPGMIKSVRTFDRSLIENWIPIRAAID